MNVCVCICESWIGGVNLRELYTKRSLKTMLKQNRQFEDFLIYRITYHFALLVA